METRIKRCWDIEGWMRGPMFEAGGFLLQKEHPLSGNAHLIYVVGRRAGRPGVFISRTSDKGHRVTAEVFAHVEPPNDIRETMELCAEIGRCAGLVSKVPFVRKYAQGTDIHTFIDFTPIPDGEEAEVRRFVSDALQVDPSHIVGFDK